MATITVTIPDTELPRVIAAFSTAYNWKPGVLDEEEFATAQVIEFIRATVYNVEQDAATVVSADVPTLDTMT